MNILIVEDEELLAMELAEKLFDLDNTVKIVGQLHSVSSTIEWLQQYKCDLIFLDIHLSDGSSFAIFEKIKVECPIIFTTAYDQYAIRAFQVNSIGYILKPISERDLRQVLDKYKKLKTIFSSDLNNLLKYLSNEIPPQKKNLDRIILYAGKTQVPINVDDIAYFMAEGRYLYAMTKNGKKYFYDNTLYKLEEELDGRQFFRLNRRFLVNFTNVISFTSYSKNRIKVKLIPEPEEEIIVSSEKIKEFKQWLVR